MESKDKSKKAMRKINRKTTSGKSKLIAVRKEKEGTHHCAICSAELLGVQNSGSKSEKIPTRVFAGHLCGKCVRKVVKIASMVKEKLESMDNISLKLKPYVEVMVKKL